MDDKEKVENIVGWIQQTVKQTGLSKAVIGISGGVDSAVSAALLAKAIGVDQVYPALFPYGDLHSHGIDDAKLLVNQLGVPEEQVTIIDIKPAVDVIYDSIFSLQQAQVASYSRLAEHTASRSLIEAQRVEGLDVRKGNIMARVRMTYLFDLAKKINGIVCGTENKTEHYLGYYTRFGDEASDIEPIRNLYKTDVWEMAKVLGIPQQIIAKAPTAGLWEGQTDEKELGFLYKDADKVLSLHFDQGMSAEQITKQGIAKEIVVKVLEQVAKNDFKHKLPYINK